MKEIYIVQEVDSDGNITTQLFNENRESAINYLKMRQLVIKQNNKDWQEEVWINYYELRKNDKYIKLYMKVLEDDITNDRERKIWLLGRRETN